MHPSSICSPSLTPSSYLRLPVCVLFQHQELRVHPPQRGCPVGQESGWCLARTVLRRRAVPTRRRRPSTPSTSSSTLRWAARCWWCCPRAAACSCTTIAVRSCSTCTSTWRAVLALWLRRPWAPPLWRSRSCTCAASPETARSGSTSERESGKSRSSRSQRRSSP